MAGGGDIGKGEFFAGEPCVLFKKVVEVVEVYAKVVSCHAKNVCVGLGFFVEVFYGLFLNEEFGAVKEEFFAEP